MVIHHDVRKFEIFVRHPEQHLPALGLTHVPDLCGGILRQPVILNGVIENATQLIVPRFQIHRGKRLAVLVLAANHFILPCDNVAGLDVTHLLLFKIRQEFGADDVLFRVPGVLFQSLLHIGRVNIRKAPESHIQLGFHLMKLLALPFQFLPFGSKSSLLGLLALALPIGIAVDNPPCVSA